MFVQSILQCFDFYLQSIIETLYYVPSRTSIDLLDIGIVQTLLFQLKNKNKKNLKVYTTFYMLHFKTATQKKEPTQPLYQQQQHNSLRQLIKAHLIICFDEGSFYNCNCAQSKSSMQSSRTPAGN